MTGASPARAQPREAPVQLAVEGLFGEGTLLGSAWAPVEVSLRNRTGRDLSGTLRVEVRGFAGAAMRHEAPVDLPPQAERSVNVSVFAQGNGEEIAVEYLVGGRVLAAASTAIDYAPAPESVVVLGDPPRLRAALTDLDVELELAGVRRQVRMPVGAVTLDPATSDPRLPERGVEWSTVRLLVASLPVLERATAAQREAIADWVRAGGRLLIYPRSAADLARPWLVAWTGAIGTGVAREPGALLVPDDVPRFGLVCGEAQRTESFGCSASLGFGRVYVADHDGTTAPAIASGRPRELVRSILAARLPSRPALSFGRGVDDLSFQEWSSGGSFGRLRRALDPNESFRPALGLVALVLFLYVILVGPLNFRWVQKRGAPVLALLTTPAAALGCIAVLLGVGYLGKGVTMRYRRVEVIEAVEGEPRMLSRRYSGLFSTRPGSFDLEGPTDGLAHRLGGLASAGPVHRHGARGIALGDVRAGLWETVFLREDRLASRGGAIRFTRDDRRLATVVNETSLVLRGAFVVDTAGEVYAVGDVAAGATVPIARTSSLTFPPHFTDGSDTYQLELLAQRLSVSEDDRDVLAGVVDLMAAHFIPDDVPVLYARAEGPRGAIGGLFDPEEDHVYVRIVPHMRGDEVVPAPAPLATDQWGEPIPVTPADEEALPLPEDAGVALDGGAPPPLTSLPDAGVPSAAVLEVLEQSLGAGGAGP